MVSPAFKAGTSTTGPSWRPNANRTLSCSHSMSGVLLPEQMNSRPALVFLAARAHLAHHRGAIGGEHPELVVGLDFRRAVV
jgi:hypothetical protein